MKVYSKIKNKVQFYIYHLNLYVDLIAHRKITTAYIFGAPLHQNMGDQAQSYCIVNWIKNSYKGYRAKIIVIPHTSNNIIKLIRKIIKKDDKIFFHSGYHLTDLYPVKDIYFRCIKTFSDYKIICFPQTINFYNQNELQNTSNIYSSHKNLILLCRDEKSYETAKNYFCVKKILLFPDIVTSLIGAYDFNNERNGVLFCIRNDIEAFYSKDQISSLKKKFSCRTEITDTTITSLSPYYIIKYRYEILTKIWNYYSTFKVIITDRYHGTIFSLISNTPVIVLSSTDHKLSSGVKWFPTEIFSDYLYYANNLDDAYKKAIFFMQNDQTHHKLPSYFLVNYYSKLKKIINE